MNAPNDVRAMLVESATRLFADHVDAKCLENAKRDGWSPALWEVIEQAELPRISIAEDAGGAGGSLSDLAAVLRVAGRYAAPAPLAETALLANWMLAECGLALPRGPLAAGIADGLTLRRAADAWIVSGELHRVAWARMASRLVVLAEAEGEPHVLMVDPAACEITPGRNLASEPRDHVRLRDVHALAHARAPVGVDGSALRLRGALARSLLMAGAMERALELAVEYARQRVQFGRKIGAFQAVQQELARCGGEVAAAVAAALSAAGAVERGADACFAVAAAKIRTAEAAREVALIAHQVHGAIGVTEEYALHHSTMRLWSWREEYGNEAQWAIALGARLQREGADALWPNLTASDGN